MKFIIVSLCLTLLIVQQSQAAPANVHKKRDLESFLESMLRPDAEEEPQEPELDWDTIKFEEITLNTKELDLQPSQLYAKVLECVKNCMQNLPKNSYRDNCIAKTCEIY